MTKPSACKYTILSWSSGFNQLWMSKGYWGQKCWRWALPLAGCPLAKAQTDSSLPHPVLSIHDIFFPPEFIHTPEEVYLKMGLGTDRKGLTLHEKTSLRAAEKFCHGSVSPSSGHAPVPPGHVTTLAWLAKAASDGQARWPERAGAVPGGQPAFLPACPARISRPGQTTSLQQHRSGLGRGEISFRMFS